MTGDGAEGRAVEIAPLTEVDDKVVAAVSALVGQLSSSARPLSRADLEAVVASPATHLLLARDSDGVLGMLTLLVLRIPTGVRAWIEDVVVDDAARGRGTGRALVEAAVELARSQGAQAVDLTSRPSREAANHLYRSVGFRTRETNVYRLTTDAPH